MKRIAIGCALALTAVLLVGFATAWPGDRKSDKSGRAQAFESFLADVARRLDVEPARLREAIEGAALDRVGRAQGAGRISGDCADFLRERIRSGHVGPLLRLAAPAWRADGRRHGYKWRWHGWLGTRGARSAEEMLEAVETRLDTAVEEGKLTRERADKILERVRAKLDRRRGDTPKHPCARR